MYTEPSHTWRQVWVGHYQRGGAPQYTPIKEIAPRKHLLVSPVAKGVRAFPNQKNADKVLERLLLLGLVTPYERQQAFIVVTEIRFDLKAGTLTRTELFNGSET